MSKKDKCLNFDIDWVRYENIRENHSKFLKSDKVGGRVWKCRVCNKEVYNLTSHLSSCHSLSNLEYYQRYVDSDLNLCLIQGCDKHISDFTRPTHRLPIYCDDPTHKEQAMYLIRSKTMTKLDNEWWEDQEYRNKVIERVKVTGFTSEKISKMNLENWKNPKYREKMEIKLSNGLRKGEFTRNKGLKGGKLLYIVKVTDSLIKLGTSAEHNKGFYRYNLMKSKYREILTVLGELNEITQLEIDLLELTDEFYRKPLPEEYDYSLCGYTEVRKIECLDLILNELNKRGYNVKAI